MATPTQIHRKGGDLAFIFDGAQGNPTLAVRDRLIGAGHKRDSTTTADVKWGVVGEPLTLSHNVAGASGTAEALTVSETFRRVNPHLQSIPIQRALHGVIPATGVIAFVNPSTSRSYVIDGITEVHSATEDTAAAANLQVVIARTTQAASAGQELLTANEIDVETSGVAVNTVSYASLDNTSESQRTVRPGDRVMILFQDDAGTSDIATVEYKGVVTLNLRPKTVDTEQNKVIRRHITADEVLATTGLDIFTAEDHRWQVTAIREVHGAAETTAATLNFKLERCQGTEAAAAGDDLLAATAVDMKAAINTVLSPAIVTTGSRDILEVGDRLKIHAALDDETANATTEYDGTIEVVLRAVAPPAVEEVFFNCYFQGSESVAVTGQVFGIADVEYRATDITFCHSVIETGTAAPSVMVERLQGTEAAEAGNDLLTAQAVDADATINAVQNGTVLVASEINVLAAGDRLVGYLTDDGSADAAVASTDLEGCITVRCEKTAGFGILNVGKHFIGNNKIFTLTSLEAEWTSAERSAPTLNLQAERLQGTEALGAGDLLHGITDINVKGTINTVDTATLLTSGVEDFADGDRLGLTFVNDAGTRINPAELDGLSVTARFQARADSGAPASQGVLFTNKTGRPVELRGAFASWDVPESAAATLNLNFERLTVNESGGAANGDLLNGLTDINVKGADDTGQEITPVTTVSIQAGVLTTGSGLDDITSGGSFVAPVGFSGRTVFTFTVDSTGTTDTFTTRRDGRIIQTKQDMATAAISIRTGDGVTVLWAAVTGHTLDDVWTVVVSRDTILEDGDRLGYYFDVDAGGTVTVPTELEGLNVITQLQPTDLAEAATT